MAFKQDTDLNFLQYCSNEDLKSLADILRYGKNGSERLAEELSTNAEFLKHYPDNLNRVWEIIAEEIQKYGGNTLRNLYRGHGVSYREILLSVCNKQKIKTAGVINKPVSDIEAELLSKIIGDTISSLSENKKEEIISSIKSRNVIKDYVLTKDNINTFLKYVFREGGTESYFLVLDISDQMSTFFTGSGLSSSTAISMVNKMDKWSSNTPISPDPLTVFIKGCQIAYKLAGPALRVMTPITFKIAFMRLKYHNDIYNKYTSDKEAFMNFSRDFQTKNNIIRTEMSKAVTAMNNASLQDQEIIADKLGMLFGVNKSDNEQNDYDNLFTDF